MRTLLMILCLGVVAVPPRVVSADACRAHCRDRARVCKDRCKLGHPEGPSPERHRCLQTCELHEHECRARC